MVDLDASKTGDSIPQEGGRGKLNENPMNLLQGGERTVAGVSPEQKVKKRKASKCGKRVKKRESKGMVHLLRAIVEENEKIKSGNDILKQKLQLRQDGIEIQKTELCVSLNKTITVQENLVEALCQEPSFQSLMVGSNHLNVAQYAMLFPNADGDVRLPSKANQSFNDIAELKHRFMVSSNKIELLCQMIIK
ncbi:PREDICTED: uncharacterized protein LOC105127203 isoform X1 [Populus euphratica]|uniref:Uncharacterized protein LOC105127203 isoform X1 n=2 Tax=Populus euphratica TaxID=75702 RepID=A0AAJ6XPP0_POPEU|nr:PREDICTED: uncharacterized protein LOC105127203 isoform X1 [Populus euphratica]XP_011026694.1 PREDICTED: uncharacterized protein LOC105127203 isoform X1 [Populus euphratica]